MHMSGQDTIEEFLEWCKINSIWIDSRLEVKSCITGISVFSKEFDIPPQTTVVKIPRDAVLSVKSCSLTDFILPVPFGIGAQLALSLALYSEIINGLHSRWYRYLQSLPKYVSLPLLWELDDDSNAEAKDCPSALSWLRGTETERTLRRMAENGLTIREEIDAYYHKVAEPLIQQHFPLSKPLLREFYYAYSLVSSRAFLVDAFHGLSMVPIADAFNHAVENHVHLQSDFSVCPECGALQECEHDQEEQSTSLSNDKRNELQTQDNDSYEMVTNAFVTPNTEVYNTYGETLTNAQLLTQYGFILDGNENDRLSWSISDICRNLGSISDCERIAATFFELLRDPVLNDVLDASARESDLIFYDTSSFKDNVCTDGDGRLSHQMWAFLALFQKFRSNNCRLTRSKWLEILKSLISQQLCLEGVNEPESSGEPRALGHLTRMVPEALVLLEQMAQSVISLCVSRKDEIGKPGYSGQDLGEILDAVPESMPCTRLAISLALSEVSILDSCEAAWMDLIAVAHKFQ